MKKVIKSLSSTLPFSHHFPSLPSVASLPLLLVFCPYFESVAGCITFSHHHIRLHVGSISLPGPFCLWLAPTHGTTALGVVYMHMASPTHHPERSSPGHHFAKPPAPTSLAQQCMQTRSLNLVLQHCKPKLLTGKQEQTSRVLVGCGGKGWSVRLGLGGSRSGEGGSEMQPRCRGARGLSACTRELCPAGASPQECLHGNIMGKLELLPF